MDATQILNQAYKQEISNAIEQKVLFQTQYEVAKEAIKQKDNEIKQLRDENLKLNNEIENLQDQSQYLDEVVEQLEDED